MGSSPPQDRGSSPLSRVTRDVTLQAGTKIAPMGHRRRSRCDTARQREQEGIVRERVRVARWRHAAARLGAVAIIAGALAGGGHGHPRRARTLLSSNHRWPCSPSTHSRADVPLSEILGCGPS
jgi:hypothetical protein